MSEGRAPPIVMDESTQLTRCDLHVHSRASRGNDEWFTRVWGCPESYVEPALQYDLCRSRGMDFVTLTDHDTIDGCLELRDRPGSFCSEEITAVFPDEDCTIHVLAWDITPNQHAAIQERRRHIYRLVDYLCEQGIVHAAAHPLLSPSWNLTAETLEKLLLMFPILERINGLLDARIASDFEYLIERVDGAVLQSWARKHGLPIRGDRRAGWAFTAGSDDHTLRGTGRVFTQVPGVARTPAEFLNEVTLARGQAIGEHASIEDMATTIQRTAYAHLRRNGAEAGRADLFVDLLDMIVGRASSGTPSAASRVFKTAVETHLGKCAPAIDLESVASLRLTPDGAAEKEAIERAQAVSDGLLADGTRGIAAAVSQFDMSGLLQAVRDVVGAGVAAGPLLGAADHFGRQEEQVRRIWSGWSAFPRPSRAPTTALFSDSMGHKDGVSTWCEGYMARARRTGEQVVVPVVDATACGGVVHEPFQMIPAVISYPLPLYSSFTLNVPSVMATLRMLWHSRVTRVELATPGPMGMVGWLAAHVLRLPVTATFHTDVVALGELLGGDPILITALRRYVGAFYRSADRVRVFSERTRDDVLRLGVAPERVDRVMPPIDPDDFSPRHRDLGIFEELGVPSKGRPVVLSVGRVSREKNLPSIIEAVGRLQGRIHPAPVLVVVGDGPERSRLESATAGGGFTFFVGHREGLVLRRLYASAQVFAFASQLDTLGLVNLEALASGLPVVVPQGSSVASLLRHDHEAYCYFPGAQGLEVALAALLEDPERSARLAVAGRRFVTVRARENES